MTSRTTRRLPKDRPFVIEWITLGLFLGCVAIWAVGLFIFPGWSMGAAFMTVVLALVLHASLTHEVLHGHPFPSRLASEALVVVNPGLFIPYLRFRDLHLAHHQDANLTDPYDDPETNYLDPAVWARLPRALRMVLRANNM